MAEMDEPVDEVNNIVDLFASSPPLSSNPRYVEYLAQLPSYGLSELLSTPTALTTQSHTLTSSITALTHSSYPTFISLYRTTSALLNSLSDLDKSLDTLILSALPNLEDASRVFRERSGPGVIEERQKARVVLEQHDKLRDLLDVPVLIDTCVRNGMYAEALALAMHVSSALAFFLDAPSQSLSQLNGSESTSIQLAYSLQAEITASLHTMRLILLHTLHESGRKLPALRKAVQFLRRMDAFPEDQLALVFVGARLACLRSALVVIDRESSAVVEAGRDNRNVLLNHANPDADDVERERDRDAENIARNLKKYIDVWREGAYDVITQYTTIFLEPSVPLSAKSASSAKIHSSSASTIIRQTLFSVPLNLILTPLVTHLPRAYPHLAPLATQLTYCGAALSRVGMDFRGALAPIISRAVIEGYTRDIREIEDQWEMTLTKARTKSKKTSRIPRPSEWLIAPSQASSSPPFLTFTASSPYSPPSSLTAFPPLAAYLNNHLRSLNRLRLLAPTAVLRPVFEVMVGSFARSASLFLDYSRNAFPEKHGGPEKSSDESNLDIEQGNAERDLLKAAGIAFVRVISPFLRRAMVLGVFGLEDWQSMSVSSSRQVVNGKINDQHVNGDQQDDYGDCAQLEIVMDEWENWLADLPNVHLQG